MKFNDAIEKTKQELLKEYKDVVYMEYEVIKMTANSTTSNFIKEIIDTNLVDVVPIKNRFKEIQGEIKALRIIFDVKRPRKRKYERYEVFYRVNE